MTPDQKWRALAAGIHDLTVEAFTLALRCHQNGGVGKAVHLGELIQQAKDATEAMRAFMLQQIDEAVAKERQSKFAGQPAQKRTA